MPRRVAAWKTSELAKLRLLYPTAPLEEIAAAFAPRSMKSVKAMAAKIKVRRFVRYTNWMEVAANHKPVIFSGAS